MPYRYVVVWFRYAKMWITEKKHPRKRPPIYAEVKPFRSLAAARKFKTQWSRDRDATIYEVRRA